MVPERRQEPDGGAYRLGKGTRSSNVSKKCATGNEVAPMHFQHIQRETTSRALKCW